MVRYSAVMCTLGPSLLFSVLFVVNQCSSLKNVHSFRYKDGILNVMIFYALQHTHQL